MHTQAVERMKVLLDRDGVEYSTKIFSTDAGISDLGDNPFVSAKLIIYGGLTGSHYWHLEPHKPSDSCCW